MQTLNTPTDALVHALAEALEARGWRLAAAESCTGGLISARCTDRAGSSVWFDRGFVTYSNEAKTDMLGVPHDLIARHGAVSEPVARAMATGALMRSQAQVAVAVTGIAGPGGAVPGKPVGTVWLAWAAQGVPAAPAAGPGPVVGAVRLQLDGDRRAVREATVQRALEQALSLARLE